MKFSVEAFFKWKHFLNNALWQIWSGWTLFWQDYWSQGPGLPTKDVAQDYKLISASEAGGKTTVEFCRDAETGDVKDVQFNVFMTIFSARRWQNCSKFTFSSFYLSRFDIILCQKAEFFVARKGLVRLNCHMIKMNTLSFTHTNRLGITVLVGSAEISRRWHDRICFPNVQIFVVWKRYHA